MRMLHLNFTHYNFYQLGLIEQAGSTWGLAHGRGLWYVLLDANPVSRVLLLVLVKPAF